MYKILRSNSFATQEAAVMAEAYEGALIDLNIVDRCEPRTESVALAILLLFRDGETRPECLRRMAYRAVMRDAQPDFSEHSPLDEDQPQSPE